MNVKPWLQRILLALGLFVAVVALAARFTGSRRIEDGALSAKPAGRRAAFYLLERTGHRVLRWRQAPASLSGPESMLLVFAGADGRSVAAGERGARDPRSSGHYRAYLEAGGRIVADVRSGDWLADSVGIELSSVRQPIPRPVSRLSTPAGEEWKVDFEETVGLPRTVAGEAGVPLLVDDEGAPFASLYSVGSGGLLLVHDAGIWRNDRIRDDDNAYALVALVGLAGGERTVLFDDFVLGAYEPSGAMHMLFAGRGAPLGWTLMLCAALGLASALRSWRFKRDPRAESEVNPFLRVRAGAHLLERARKPRAIAARLRSGVSMRLARRLRLDAGDDELLWKAVASRAEDDAQRERWDELMRGDLPNSAASLERWALELSTIEHAVEDSLHRETQVGAGHVPRWKHG